MPKHARQSSKALTRLGAVLALIAALFMAGYVGHSINRPSTITISHEVKVPILVPTSPTNPHHPSTNHHKPSTTYKVRAGDSLWSIAGHIFHNPLEWHHLWEINHHLIPNPNVIHVGTVLQLE